jgi:uncharacterized membrane protein
MPVVGAGKERNGDMSHLAVITFANLGDARAARQALGGLERQGRLKVIDAAVITKERDDKLQVDNELESSTKTGALVGGLLGALLFFMFPPAGLVLGAVGGALVGKTLEPGIDQGFVRDVTATLQPGRSALFVLFQADDLGATLIALRPFKGTLLHTTLPTETEAALRHALE